MQTEAELLRQFQADNLRLVAENLRIRGERRKLRNAFRRYCDLQLIRSRQKAGVLDYRCRDVIPVSEVTEGMVKAV